MKYNFSFLYFFYIFLFIFLAFSCAIPKAPTGGPKDEKPPILNNTFPIQKSKNLYPKQIKLLFNEKVILLNPSQEISIIPGFHPRYKVKADGKSVLVSFETPDSINSFLPNTTYRISFGKSIVDITEGNVSKNIEFIFSTGSLIDSAQIQGIILDAFTLKPIPNALVRLDSKSMDSSLFKIRTKFFVFSDVSGLFKVSYLKDSTFDIFVHEDRNVDYLLNPDEKVDLNKKIKSRYTYKLDTFLLSNPLDFLPSAKKFVSNEGIVSVKLSKGVSLKEIIHNKNNNLDYELFGRDSIVFKGGSNKDSASLILNRLNDTVHFNIGVIQKVKMDTFPIVELKEIRNIEFSYALGSLKTDRILIDSIGMKQIKFFALPDSIKIPIQAIQKTPFGFKVFLKELPDEADFKQITFKVPRGTFVIKESFKPLKEIQQTLEFESKENYGNLVLNIKDSLQKEIIIILQDEKGKIILKQKISKSEKIEITNLEKGKIKVFYYSDKYLSNEWTPIQFWKKIPALRITYFPEDIDIRPNWDVVKDLEIK